MAFLFQVKQHRVVAGLKWAALGSKQKAKTELVEAAAAAGVEKATHGVILASAENHVYGAVVPGNAPQGSNSAISGAAWLALTVKEPTLLVQRVDARNERYWIVFVRPGSVDPSTDILVSSPEKAAERVDMMLQNAYHQGEVVRVLTNDVEALSGSYSFQHLSWEDELDSSQHKTVSRRQRRDFAGYIDEDEPPRDARVRQIAGVRKGVVYTFVFGMAGIAALFAGNVYLNRMRAAKELAEMQAQIEQDQIAQQEIATLRDVRIAQAVAQALAEDTATPRPSALLLSCRRVAGAVSERVAGWMVKGVECTSQAKQARVTLERRDAVATNAGLAAFAADANWGITIDPAGNAATLSVPFDAGEIREALKPGALPTSDGIVLYEGSKLQRWQRWFTGLQTVLTAAQAKSITYLDPEHEQAQAASERFKPVPAEQSYQVGSIKLEGMGVRRFDVFDIDAPYLSAKRVFIEPQPRSQAGDKYTVEITYVIGNA